MYSQFMMHGQKNITNESLFPQPRRTAGQQWTLLNTRPNLIELRHICTVRGQWGSWPANHVMTQQFLETVTKVRNKSIKMGYHERSNPEHRSSQISKPYCIRFCHAVVSPWQRSALCKLSPWQRSALSKRSPWQRSALSKLSPWQQSALSKLSPANPS